MNEVINKIQKWCKENNFCKSSNISNNNFYYIYKEGVTEQIDVYWGTSDESYNRKYNLVVDINTNTDMVIYQLVDLSEDGVDDPFGNSMRFTHNDYIMGESFYLKDIDENFNGLRRYLASMFIDLTPFPMFNEE